MSQSNANTTEREFQKFDEFYEGYLSQHRDPRNRKLHFIGTGIGVCLFVYMLCSMNWWLAPLIPAAGFGFSWYGHRFLEKNKPDTWSKPMYSLFAHYRMFADIIAHRIYID